MTSTRTRDGCLPADTLGRAARGELGLLERGRVADHLASCGDCAEELKLIEPLGAWAERSVATLGRSASPAFAGAWLPAWQLAAAALLVVAGGLLLWNMALQRENRELVARVVPAAAPAAAPAPATAAAPELFANSVIVDLQTDALRSGRAAAAEAVPATAGLVTVILNSELRYTSREYRLDLVDANGRSRWHSDALHLTPFGTFTLSFSPAALGPGQYRLEISRPSGGRQEIVETYALRIEGQGP
jgi:hypothetical protein